MTLAQLALEIDPTPAMDAGTQTVWQCSMCGTVVVLTSLAKVKKPGQCPGHDETGTWTRQALPVAGLRRRTVAVDRGDLDLVLAGFECPAVSDEELAAFRRVEEAMWETTT